MVQKRSTRQRKCRLSLNPQKKTTTEEPVKPTVQHNYLKATSMKDLLAAIENPNTKAKKIHKYKKEIVRRKKVCKLKKRKG